MMTEQQTGIIRETFPVGPLQCNCSIIGDPIHKKAMIIDPGGDADFILQRVQQLGLTVVALVHTHAHLDHFMASGELKEKTGAPIYLHQQDEFLWQALETQCRMFGVPFKPVPAPDVWLRDEDTLPCCDGVAIHTPGHSPGSMSFWFEGQKLLVAGDTLFRGAVGRTDLWGGDYSTLERSIRGRLYTLDESVIVVAGHGPNTTIGAEIRGNMVIRGR